MLTPDTALPVLGGDVLLGDDREDATESSWPYPSETAIGPYRNLAWRRCFGPREEDGTAKKANGWDSRDASGGFL